ncbi:helix-turn-helix transcriptional regulator [Actinomadura sp. KC06]|uniref:helix-turn-helix transcriptional regulator n=1 Tax=Actinomadura sp. KC06 TaxID=2530369 RepID=UPI0014048A57|nr:helix-turn-helix transcriptional regulator [Actinomadura sp. KC06]
MIEDKRLPQDKDRLFRARVRARLSQQQLADKAGISKSTVSRLENGRVAAEVETLHQVADALGLPVEDLMPLDPALARQAAS